MDECKPLQPSTPPGGTSLPVTSPEEKTDKAVRAERLAKALRDNLRRRKAVRPARPSN